MGYTRGKFVREKGIIKKAREITGMEERIMGMQLRRLVGKQ